MKTGVAAWFGVMVLAGVLPSFEAPSATNETQKGERWFYYTNDINEDVPLSIHVVRIERSHHDFEFCTTLGKGTNLGMAIVSEQIKAMPSSCGQPLAAINGDFYEKSEKYLGRPRDVQIFCGEVISSPAGHACFWMDAQDRPHMTNVFSKFRVIWPDGKNTAIGLNQLRDDDAAVLYTAVTGASTRTTSGTELILERSTNGPWLPLRIGQVYSANVREVRQSGNAPLDVNTMVLSIGPTLTARVPAVKAGAVIQIATESVPDLSGAEVAIGGGPALVQDGKPMQWSGFIHIRHPRTALGWNNDYIFMVEVDGRQSNLSVGMTFPELAAYLVKLGCQQAINFDGGGSATLWALGAVRSSPSEGDERPSANALVLVKKRSPAKPH
jgi:hypothetical protein